MIHNNGYYFALVQVRKVYCQLVKMEKFNLFPALIRKSDRVPLSAADINTVKRDNIVSS